MNHAISISTSQTRAEIISLYGSSQAVANNSAFRCMQQPQALCIPEEPGEMHHLGFNDQNLKKLVFGVGFCSLKLL